MPYLNISLGSVNIIVLLITVGASLLNLLYVLKNNRKLWFVIILFNLYIIALMVITTSDNPNPSGAIPPVHERLDLVPFLDIANAFKYNISNVYLQFFLNIVMFIPMGLLLPIIYEKSRSYGKIALISFCVTLTIELIQLLWPHSNRIFDVDDLICNTAGALIGYSIWKLIIILRLRENKKSFRFIVPVAVCVLFVMFSVRPFIVLDYDMTMNDAPRSVPMKTLLSKDMQYDDIKNLPVYSIAENVDVEKENYFSETVGENNCYDVQKIIASDTSYIKRDNRNVEIIPIEKAIERVNMGIVISAYNKSYTSTPQEVYVKNATLYYMPNKAQTKLLPVWCLTGKINKYDIGYFWVENDGEMMWLKEGDDYLLTDELLESFIIVPAF